MRKRRHVAAAMVVVACLGGIVWFVVRNIEPEPIYQGKPLSHWLKGYVVPGTNAPTYQSRMQRIEDRRMANAALSEAGTNAIPCLLRMLGTEDGPARRGWMGLAGWLPFLKIQILSAELQHEIALDGFSNLGVVASNAVPSLIASYRDNMSDDSKINVLKSLAGIREHSELCVPLLIKAMRDKSSQVRFWAVLTIGIFRANAKSARPAILGLLQDEDRNVRSVATNALLQIDPAAMNSGQIYIRTP